MKSLRDMGYDFAQAVADIVDNSIEAKATLVAIDVEFDGDNSWVRIADNGKGMKPEQLREAMRYGVERDYEEEDLGKFGLGLKTASLSQCQCLSVASRWNNDRADIAAYSWDMGHVERTNRWEILPLERDDLGPAIRKPLKDTRGTVVLWQRLDRILGYKHPYGEAQRKRLLQTCREIELHLGMVFHRFLTGQVRGKRFKLLLNGNEVRPWDPFCRTEAKTKKLQEISIPVDHNGVSGEVLLEPFVLPHQDDFSSVEAHRLASGPASWNQQQGFYIYRAGRMIQSGGWSNLRAPDEHMKLARIAVSFSPALDEAFKINVAKMRVQMPPQIRDAVHAAIGPVMKLAREAYDRKQAQTPASHPGESPSNRRFDTEKADISTTTHDSQSRDPLLTLQQWSKRTLAAATKRERPVVKAVLGRLRTPRAKP
nr:ATP-binding protein [Nitrospirota bacterium]